MRVQADNINGICKLEDADLFEGTVMDEEDFYDSLKDNSDDSVICADLSDEMAEKIEAEYGIKK